MKKWLAAQILEITAWFGLALVIMSFLPLPHWSYLVTGILLISIDDVKASDFLKKMAPKLTEWIDDL